MFRLHRHKSDKSGERIEFKFSHIQALQVPKEWDKIFVSIISGETGKVVAKSSKALVRNGKCVWKESFSESIWISSEFASRKMEDNLFKLVVSMGSARSSILGEADINLTNYISSRTPVPVSLPLKKNKYGTVLQVKVHCLNPREAVRDEQLQDTLLEDMNADYDETDNKSDISDNSYAMSVGSSSSNHLGSTSHPGEVASRNTSFSASGSRHSSDSAEGFLDKATFSPRHNFSGDLYIPIGRQESSASQNTATHRVAPAEDIIPSNHSSFNSRFTSGSDLHGQRQDLGQNSSNSLVKSSLRNTSSSKDLIEAAEDTIEELRAEAKMWERNARKLMIDVDLLKKEASEKSRCQADQRMELSAACSERDGLKLEIEQLNRLLEESKLKHMASEHSISHAEGISHVQKELESEIKFQKESNTNLAVQLKKTQESNIELVSILQELEETIEQQRMQIDNLSAEREKFNVPENGRHGNDDAKGFGSESNGLQMYQEPQKELQAELHLLEDKNKDLELEIILRNKTLLELEADFKSKLSTKENEVISLEAKLSDLCSSRGSKEEKFSGGVDSVLIKEIEELKEKVQELESDCNELTEENLELVFKLKEAKKDLRGDGDSSNSLSSELQSTISTTASEPEVDSLKSQSELKQDPKDREVLPEAISPTHLEVKVLDLQKNIADLELQLHSSQEKASNLEAQLCNSQDELEERGMEITALQKELKDYQDKQANSNCILSETGPDKLDREFHCSEDMSGIFLELHNQLKVALTRAKMPWCNGSSPVNTGSESVHNDLVTSDATKAALKFQAEALLRNFKELNELLEAKSFKSFKFETAFQHIEVEQMEGNPHESETEVQLEEYDFEENDSYQSTQARGSSETDLDVKVTDISKNLLTKGTQIVELEASLSSKEGEIQILRRSQKEMEERISDLEKQKLQLEENLEVVSRGSSITTKCLDDVRNDLTVLTSNLDSHVSENKMLQRKSSELESGKHEFELHLLELEEENVQLSERLSGMEAQLRYLTDEKESSRLDLENSKSLSTDLCNEIKRLETEMENQKVDLKRKLQEMQKRWSEAQEECEYLKKANPKLQATAESLIEECDSMQKLNGELRKQKLELHERCTHLEAELRESRNNCSESFKKIEICEAKLSLMQEDLNSKQEVFTFELDSLLHEYKEHKEKLVLEESLLGQMYMEKTVEVESLQREVAHLTEQISATHDEREKIASNAVRDVSTLRAEKAKLESALQEAQANCKSSETKLQNLQLESETIAHGLGSELASARQNQDFLMADNEKLQRSLDEVKLSEARFRNTVSGLELKLTASEYERQQVVEEVANLKVQLQKIGQLQDVIVELKNSLSEVKFEKNKLETSLQLLSVDCEELKAQNSSYIEKISSMQKSVSELDDCKRCKVALEEKLLRLEGDLTAREALCAQDAELKNELNRIKRANSQFQRKIQSLQDEKDEWLKRAQELESELKLKKEGNQQSESISKASPEYESITRDDLSQEELKHIENGKLGNGVAKSRQRSMKMEENGQPREENGNKRHDDNGVDVSGKIELLENELAEALEANQMYKLQLKKLLTDGENTYANDPKKLTGVEAELKDIRERYFHMSLRFAEVEAQREELVMQIKNLKSGRRWFS